MILNVCWLNDLLITTHCVAVVYWPSVIPGQIPTGPPHRWTCENCIRARDSCQRAYNFSAGNTEMVRTWDDDSHCSSQMLYVYYRHSGFGWFHVLCIQRSYPGSSADEAASSIASVISVLLWDFKPTFTNFLATWGQQKPTVDITLSCFYHIRLVSLNSTVFNTQEDMCCSCFMSQFLWVNNRNQLPSESRFPFSFFFINEYKTK